MTIDAPDRSVCALTGEIADGLSFPATRADDMQRLISDNERLDRENANLTEQARKVFLLWEEAVRQRDDAIAERDNLVDLTIEVGRLGNYLRHAIADRDEYRERADEWRDKYEGAQCRMDEMAAEVRELTQRLADAETARDTANARASL